jgi:hypothetical protein
MPPHHIARYHLSACPERGPAEASNRMNEPERHTGRDAKSRNNQQTEREPAHTWQQGMAHALRIGPVPIVNRYRSGPLNINKT